jgi:ABC-type transport system substrate-binding protein
MQVEIEEAEFVKIIGLQREKKTHGLIFPNLASYRLPLSHLRSRLVSTKEGTGHEEYAPLDEAYYTIVESSDPAERERLLQGMGDFLFDNYLQVPLVYLKGDILVNPETVGEYVFPGNIVGVFSHFEYAKPAQ